MNIDAQKYLMNTYSRMDLNIARGNGCFLYDKYENKYLDFLSGIASCPLGHLNPKIVEKMKESAEHFTNVSNLFYTGPQVKLAQKLTHISSMKKCFFSNSGTEANEAALKLAIVNTKKHEFIACKNGFHGRTLGSLSTTFEPKYRDKFEPLISEVKFVEYGQVGAIKKAISEKTAAVIIEPIQGEAGVIVPPEEYLKEVYEICSEKGVLMILDEVQTGNGRTGSYFEFQKHGFKPDILTTAKGLANGLPIGVTISNGLDFNPGDHASTFGGNSFVTSVALSVIEEILNSNLIGNAAIQGEYIKKEIEKLKKKEVIDVRGKGLMIGIELEDEKSKDKAKEFLKKGVILNAAHKTIRLLPPLIISKTHADSFISVFDEVIS